ncbi:molybdenum cofactor guanylyltransferase [uncultured Parasphingorhabdus sp.]|uniref:molybdenum cofactor guanylyltransferase n=1 Tax=uncultured Parasphingorhabdus sp. TaxID=2709694 RepID=UPI002AA7BAE9|nr:molybdenum cofactor guanylyltransferase [uncultured Parasphingorhabdus sp.]
MTTVPSSCLVILAGGRSTRMGSDKAVIPFEGQRLIDRLVRRYSGIVDCIWLSAREDYGTGLPVVCDDPEAPAGPVGGIFSLAAALQALKPAVEGFVTVPVDAPHAPEDLIAQLSASGRCAVAQDPQRIHPTFAYWRCDTVTAVRADWTTGARAPSLQWLARQCQATFVTWPDSQPFININRPEDLTAAAAIKKAGA